MLFPYNDNNMGLGTVGVIAHFSGEVELCPMHAIPQTEVCNYRALAARKWLLGYRIRLLLHAGQVPVAMQGVGCYTSIIITNMCNRVYPKGTP
jgi:hypothetical protein